MIVTVLVRDQSSLPQVDLEFLVPLSGCLLKLGSMIELCLFVADMMHLRMIVLTFDMSYITSELRHRIKLWFEIQIGNWQIVCIPLCKRYVLKKFSQKPLKCLCHVPRSEWHAYKLGQSKRRNSNCLRHSFFSYWDLMISQVMTKSIWVNMLIPCKPF